MDKIDTSLEDHARLLPKVAQMACIPPDWSLNKVQMNKFGAAVMLLFLLDPLQPNRQPRVVLTRRSTKVNSHKGQISLPGGRRSHSEEVPSVTALREIKEEIGIESHHIHLIGSLKPFQALDGSFVLPLVGWCCVQETSLVANQDEVAEILLVDWTRLVRSESRPFSFNLFGIKKNSHLFTIDNNRIWGLTAAILYEADLTPK